MRKPVFKLVAETKEILWWLQRYESRNVTFVAPDGSWPIAWERARGVHVWDADGRRYLDLTGAFGVAAAGHANPRVVKAGQRQMGKLLHAMGDVHPHALKAMLARELSRLTFERWTARSAGDAAERSGKTIFCNSGFEAVEAALKTAMLATGKPGVIVFEGAYHGLGYGALNATQRAHFRGPFVSQLREFGHFAPFPVEDFSPGMVGVGPASGAATRTKANGTEPLQAILRKEAGAAGTAALRRPRQRAADALGRVEERMRKILRQSEIGAILVEPIQVRGGVRVPVRGFLPMLRRFANEHRVLLILDEIYTGFGRTGAWFACEHDRVVPDLICLGKALTGGFPLSACVGRAELMDDAWPASTGEAIHTSTFLGHPVGCAMALAQIAEIQKRNLVRRSATLGKLLLKLLREISPAGVTCRARGMGLLAGLELTTMDGAPATEETMRVIKSMLHRGYILLPEGADGNVISFTPPLTIGRAQLARAVGVLAEVLAEGGALNR